jgi:hypothetical protein
MIEFITDNLATIIAAVIVFALVGAAVWKLIHDKRRHKPLCGCGCDGCPLSNTCHKKPD